MEEDAEEFEQTMKLFQESFAIFNKTKLDKDELREVFITMDVPCEDDDFQQQLDNIDQD
jgi:hypothetical protein